MSRRPGLFVSFARAAAVVGLILGATAQVSAAPMKVACTGTSAMMGLGSSAGQHVPDEMGKVLGANFTVTNHGVQGTTAINSLGTGYAKTAEYRAALALNPDIVLFWFGGNDSFAGTWENNKASFKPDYTAMVKAFQALPTKPKTFLVRLWVNAGAPVRRDVLDKEILPIINEIAVETGSTVIDYRTLIEANPGFLPDGMHPSNAATKVIGKLFADTVTMTLAQGGPDGGVLPEAGSGDVVAPAMDTAAADVGPISMGTGGSGSGGASGSGSGGASGGGSGGAPPVMGTGGSTVPPRVDGGSGGCSVGGQPGLGLGAIGLLLGLTLTALRRRRLVRR